MYALFHDHPSAVDATLEIAERCNLEIPLDVLERKVKDFGLDADAIAAAGVPAIDAEAMVRAVISALVRAPLE